MQVECKTNKNGFSLSSSVCLIILYQIEKGKLSYIMWLELKPTNHCFLCYYISSNTIWIILSNIKSGYFYFMKAL